uniref:Uncharacterized protein n=1 Tax=Aegilops tauschii subsp. strangulata TaxID=200361 RepID=A0A453DHW4_AEGTS
VSDPPPQSIGLGWVCGWTDDGGRRTLPHSHPHRLLL